MPIGDKALKWNGAQFLRRPSLLRAALTDSHFISAALSLGCDNSRCQIRAWNDSVCGVMLSRLITGTRTHALEILAVNPPSRPTMPQILAVTCLALDHWSMTLGKPPQGVPVFPQWIIDRSKALRQPQP